MSNVTLSIGGRNYTLACTPGEETHVRSLGRIIDGKLSSLETRAGQSESRMLLYAAILLADELHEARLSGDAARKVQGELASALDRLAGCMENLAEELEGGGPEH